MRCIVLLSMMSFVHSKTLAGPDEVSSVVSHANTSGLTVAQGWKAVPSAFGWSVVYPALEVYRSASRSCPSPLSAPPLASRLSLLAPRPSPLAPRPCPLVPSFPSLLDCAPHTLPAHAPRPSPSPTPSPRPSPCALALLGTLALTNALSPLPSRSPALAHPRPQARPTRLARDSALRAPNCTDPKCTGGCLCLTRDSADEAFRGDTVVSNIYFTVSSLASGVHRSKPKGMQQNDYATAIVFADYDGDGDQDVVLRVECPEAAGGINTTDVKIYLNQGNGRLVEAEAAGLTRGGGGATTQAWGDYTGDGVADLVIGYQSGRLRLFQNQNNSFVEDSQSILFERVQAGNGISSLHFADFNNDGHLDLLVSMQECMDEIPSFTHDKITQTQIWINDGNGNFTTRHNIVCAFTQRAVVGDLNSDGLPDLVFLNLYESIPQFAGSSRSKAGLQVFLNDASNPGASFVLDTYVSGTGGTSLDVGDVDGDGDLDLWVGSSVPEPALYLNDGAGKFMARPGALPQACTAKHARFADVDNDGDNDMLMLCTDMLLYINSGNGEFTKMTNWLQNEDGTSPEGGFTRLWNAEFTDVDNDNDIDILVETETGWALLLNSARGEAVEAVSLLDPGTGGSSYPIEASAFSDVNGDGYPDMFVASSMVRRARGHA